MSLLEKISEKEFTFMDNYICNYADTEGNPSEREAPFDYILRYWVAAKSRHLIKIFDGNLILKREIDYEIPFEDLRNNFIDSLTSQEYDFFNNLYNLTEIMFPVEERFEEPNITNYNCYISVCTAYSLMKGTTDNKFEIPMPDGKIFKITPGTKISRIMRKVSAAYKIPGWEVIREKAAIALTFKKVRGNACLSIHPLDYWTMSDNEEGWKSCMSWRKPGEYRIGTLEMMNSPYVVIGYLEHPSHKLEGFWNSKVWRELYIVDNQIITSVKAYNTENEYLSKFFVSWLHDLAEKANFGNYHNELLTINHIRESDNSQWFREQNIDINIETNYMYNDFARELNYCYITNNHRHDIRLNFSGIPSCILCGEEIKLNYFLNEDNENTLICDSCYNKNLPICHYCEHPCNPENDIYVDYVNEYVCSECLCNHFQYAEDICEYLPKEMVELIYLSNEYCTGYYPNCYIALSSLDSIKKYGKGFLEGIVYQRNGIYYVPKRLVSINNQSFYFHYYTNFSWNYNTQILFEEE